VICIHIVLYELFKVNGTIKYISRAVRNIFSHFISPVYVGNKLTAGVALIYVTEFLYFIYKLTTLREYRKEGLNVCV